MVARRCSGFSGQFFLSEWSEKPSEETVIELSQPSAELGKYGHFSFHYGFGLHLYTDCIESPMRIPCAPMKPATVPPVSSVCLGTGENIPMVIVAETEAMN